MLRDADELIDAQYAGYPGLRPIADATALDLTLRLDIPAGGRVDAIRVRADDPFDRRVRLTGADQVDEDLLDVLAAALDQNR
jgi:hypothetical protein